ncbi:MAG: serine hydrolase [Anaerolineales bacterium]|nr:serine hydrolase [Anaerolineales bacterium]
MRSRRSGSMLRWVFVGLVIVSMILLAIELIAFSRMQTRFPTGMEIGGVPVGNLDRQEAAERLRYVYSLPVELNYNDAVIHLSPSVIDFNLDLESMLAAADLQRAGGAEFWTEFWDFMWGRETTPEAVPLAASYSETLLRSYLQSEVAPRYDRPATAAQPIVGTTNFQPGSEGTTIDINGAVFQIENALRSPTQRSVDLPIERTNPERPSLPNLETLLKQTIEISEFDGLAGVYLYDLETAQEVHFLIRDGQEIAVQPDVAFTAASMIKIPIMVSVYRRLDENPNQEVLRLLSEMIIQSGNDPSDWVMEQVIDPTLGPLAVTEDMQALGLESTFLAGHFYAGAPLLVRYETPGNTREDLTTDPDTYNQTTLTEMGSLLVDLYRCADTGGGTLTAVFPGEITQAECQDMVNLLTQNKIGVLIEAGVPEGTRVAHKHGWVSDNAGVIRTIADAGIVFSPSRDYVLVIFFNHPVQTIFDPVSETIASLSAAVYNYYNLPSE